MRCVTCGKVLEPIIRRLQRIAQHRRLVHIEKYISTLQGELQYEDVLLHYRVDYNALLDKVGIPPSRLCCRSNVLSSI